MSCYKPYQLSSTSWTIVFRISVLNYSTKAKPGGVFGPLWWHDYLSRSFKKDQVFTYYCKTSIQEDLAILILRVNELGDKDPPFYIYGNSIYSQYGIRICMTTLDDYGTYE